MRPDPPELPDREAWRRRGVTVVAELHAGKQSRVFAASIDGRDVAVKLSDRSLTDRDVLAARMDAVVAAAAHDPQVVDPVRIGNSFVGTIGGWLLTATPLVDGDGLDITDPGHSRRMGEGLALLHRALANVRAPDVPPVAALADVDDGRSGWQLLHGDFSDENIVATADGLRVFDFDDCGHGPIEYDVANSLFMVKFDADVSDRPARYHAFRPAFLAGYAAGSGRLVDDTAVDAMIRRRIGALARWIADPTTAPIGVRTSSPEWLDTLAGFVRSQGSTDA